MSFRPIDYQPLDVLPGANMLLAARRARASEDLAKQNAETQRMYAENTNKRMSAQDAREQERHRLDLADRARRADIERSQMLLPTSPLMRAARQVGAQGASAIGKPYGISFQEDKAPPPSLAGTDLFKAAGNSYGKFAADTLAGPAAPAATEEGRVDAVSGGEAPPAGVQVETQPEAPSPVEQAMAQLENQKPQPSKLFAAVGGQRFEVPTVSDSTGLGDKYDQVYGEILRRTGDEGKAYQAVLHMREKDDSATAVGDRVAAGIDAREREALRSRKDVETQLSEAEKNRENALEAARIAGRSRIAAAGSGFKQEGANDRVMGLLDRRMENVKRTTAWTKLVNEDRTVRGLMTNIASGTVPLQHRDAQIQLARFFRQAQPTEGEMHLLYNNLGGTLDKWNQFVARISNGDLSKEQMRQLQASAQQVDREHKEAIQRTYEAVRHSVGAGSGFENMPDNVNSYVRGMFAELGEDVPDVYGDTEGGVTLGAKAPPKAKPKARTPTPADGANSESDDQFLNRILK